MNFANIKTNKMRHKNRMGTFSEIETFDFCVGIFLRSVETSHPRMKKRKQALGTMCKGKFVNEKNKNEDTDANIPNFSKCFSGGARYQFLIN